MGFREQGTGNREKVMLLEGKQIAEKIKEGLRKEIAALKEKRGSPPGLVAVQVGKSPSSLVYINSQKKAAESVGIDYKLVEMPGSVSQSEAEKTVRELSADRNVTAIILELPLPPAIDGKRLVGVIPPAKDAEGMHPENLGRVLTGDSRIGPCTAMAVMALLESTGVKLYGKEAVVVGHSDIVGKPLALMLLNKFVTTTVCHIATGERGTLAEHVKRAEILVSAVGKDRVIKGEWVKEGAIVIDVGMNRSGEKLVGDVEFDAASKKASYITPVPGGVGPVTTAILMRNVVELCRAQ